MGVSNKSLTYVIVPLEGISKAITLDLFDAEYYDSAVVIQQLVGNLVYLSNQGRYEPKIAESWNMLSPFHWSFKLRPGFSCENGELITPASFKKSLETSIRLFGKESPIPVFSKLTGYKEFMRGAGALPGIVAGDTTLDFRFDEQVRFGLIQYLSFSQFGYICKENYTSEGNWRSRESFVSSGPYKVASVDWGKRYLLKRRPEWQGAEGSPETVEILQHLPDPTLNPTIVDSKTPLRLNDDRLTAFKLVPEYLTHVTLGRLNSGFFSNPEYRRAFRAAIERRKGAIAGQINTDILAPSVGLFPNQPASEHKNPESQQTINRPLKPLEIPGTAPGGTESPKSYTWTITKQALEDLGWPYTFVENLSSWNDVTDNRKWDLRFGSQGIGSGVEPWLISSVFCTEVGPAFPDPTGNICRSLKEFEDEAITEAELARKFFQQVDEDSAVIPIGHHGMHWYISSDISQDSISPLTSVIRFEDLRIK